MLIFTLEMFFLPHNIRSKFLFCNKNRHLDKNLLHPKKTMLYCTPINNFYVKQIKQTIMTDRTFLLKLIASGDALPSYAVRDLFMLENSTELIKAYIKRHSFNIWDNTMCLLFDRPDSPELVLAYVKEGHTFNPELEYKLFELPNAQEVLTIYVAHNLLFSNLAQLKLFMFPNVVDILRTYIEQGNPLGPKAQVKLFDLPAPYAKEIVKLYAKYNFNLCPDFKRLMRKNRWNLN